MLFSYITFSQFSDRFFNFQKPILKCLELYQLPLHYGFHLLPTPTAISFPKFVFSENFRIQSRDSTIPTIPLPHPRGLCISLPVEAVEDKSISMQKLLLLHLLVNIFGARLCIIIFYCFVFIGINFKFWGLFIGFSDCLWNPLLYVKLMIV